MQLDTTWQRRIQTGTVPKSLIICGQERLEMAKHLALAYLCTEQTQQKPCMHCAACRKIQAGNHPDVRFEMETPKVDAVRALRSDAYIRPNEGAYKLYVLEAKGLNLAAQNTLLKLLEDGPAYAVFFFLLPNPEALLPTLRSRCEILQTQGEATARELGEPAKALLVQLCSKTPDTRALLTLCVGLERCTREEFLGLLEDCMEAFVQTCSHDTALLLARIDLLRDLRARCEANHGVGHLCGLLLCGLLPQ